MGFVALLNTGAALCTAWACNARVLAVSGQVHLDGIDSGYGHLHEIPDQLGLIRHLTKWAERINHPSETPAVMQRAFSELRSGRPRPVEIEMPMDVMAAVAQVVPAQMCSEVEPPPIDEDLVKEAARLLAEAKRPLIVVGSGALDAAGELMAVSQRLQAPVISKRKGKGVMPDDLSGKWNGSGTDTLLTGQRVAGRYVQARMLSDRLTAFREALGRITEAGTAAWALFFSVDALVPAQKPV